MIYAPSFILSQLQQGKLRGWLDAYVVRGEIANFSKLYEKQLKLGDSSARQIGEVLEATFGGPLRTLDQRGGIVIRLNEDSFWALLPRSRSGHPKEWSEVLDEMQAGFEGPAREPGNPDLQVRMLLGYGRINWRILPNELQHEYVFYGKELEVMEQWPASAKSLLFTPAAAKNLSIRIQPGGVGKRISEPKLRLFHAPRQDWADELRLAFVHPRWRNLVPSPFFRKVVCTHARITLPDSSGLEGLVRDLELLAITFGAYVRNLRKRGNEYSVNV